MSHKPLYRKTSDGVMCVTSGFLRSVTIPVLMSELLPLDFTIVTDSFPKTTLFIETMWMEIPDAVPLEGSRINVIWKPDPSWVALMDDPIGMQDSELAWAIRIKDTYQYMEREDGTRLEESRDARADHTDVDMVRMMASRMRSVLKMVREDAL